MWPLSQVLWAASVQATIDPDVDLDVLWSATHWYRSGPAFVDNRPRGNRYFDDNAWLGLVAAQQAQLTGEPRWWDRARMLGRYLLQGVAANGAVCWAEHSRSHNACSTGSAGLLFATLAHHGDSSAPWSENSQAAAQFLHAALLRSDGLIADHVDTDGRIEHSVWSYNQGLAVALFDRTDHPDWSAALIAAVNERLAPQLHQQPAVFNSIWYRTLLARHPNTEPPELLHYLAQTWQHGRDGRGLFSRVQRYDDGVVIDHAALTGLLSAVAAPPEVRAGLL